MLSLYEGRSAAARTPFATRLASITALLACCAPLLVLNLNGWSNAVLFVAALLSLVLLAQGRLPPAGLGREDRRWMWAVILAFAAPLAASFMSAAMRSDFFHRQFDAPSRFLLAIPIFLFMLRSRMSAATALQWTLPLALVISLAQLEIVGPDPKWPSNRQTTLVVDPLVFGYMTQAFGLMCLLSLSPRDWREGRRWSVLLRIAGVALGLYLSARSGTRSGWAAVPIVVGIWLHHNWGRGHRLATAAVLAAALLTPVALYQLMPAVAVRIDAMVDQIAHYSWTSIPSDSSVGMRITYLRIAADVLSEHFWAGLGDTSRLLPELMNSFPYASRAAVKGAFVSGFHNQILSNTIRNGVPGLVGTAALLLVPLLVCARALRGGIPGTRKDAAMGVAFATSIFVTSQTTEVVDLKFAASLYAVLAAVLCGAALARREEPHDQLGAGAD